jgi:hypothetical protein
MMQRVTFFLLLQKAGAYPMTVSNTPSRLEKALFGLTFRATRLQTLRLMTS